MIMIITMQRWLYGKCISSISDCVNRRQTLPECATDRRWIQFLRVQWWMYWPCSRLCCQQKAWPESDRLSDKSSPSRPQLSSHRTKQSVVRENVQITQIMFYNKFYNLLPVRVNNFGLSYNRRAQHFRLGLQGLQYVFNLRPVPYQNFSDDFSPNLRE